MTVRIEIERERKFRASKKVVGRTGEGEERDGSDGYGEEDGKGGCWYTSAAGIPCLECFLTRPYGM